MTWAFSAPRFSRCAGGAGLGIAGDYQRSTDPWLSFSPDGRLHAIGLSFDNSTARNAVLAAFSDDRGATWSTPRVLRFDNPRAVGNNFNDKETLTADPFDASLVYATWQRIVSPSERAAQEAYANAASFHSEAWFARSTDGGFTWDPPVVVDRAPRRVDAFTPMVDVDAQGRVAVSYYDFRNDRAGDPALSTDLWITHSHDGGRTFTDESRVTPTSFDMRQAPDALGYSVGDYTGFDHAGTTFHPTWVGPTDVFHRTAG